MSKKMIYERNGLDGSHRLILEETERTEWDTLKNDFARNVNSFSTSFIRALIPALILGLTIFVLLLTLLNKMF